MKAKEMQAIMIEKLKDGPKTAEELAVASGFTKDQVWDRMRRARVEGLVVTIQEGKESFYWDKEQWDHVNAKKQDKGPITLEELERIRKYLRPGFKLRVCCYAPKKGDEGTKTIRTKHVKWVSRHVVTFEEGGSVMLTQVAKYFRDGSKNRYIR